MRLEFDQHRPGGGCVVPCRRAKRWWASRVSRSRCEQRLPADHCCPTDANGEYHSAQGSLSDGSLRADGLIKRLPACRPIHQARSLQRAQLPLHHLRAGLDRLPGSSSLASARSSWIYPCPRRVPPRDREEPEWDATSPAPGRVRRREQLARGSQAKGSACGVVLRCSPRRS